MKKYTEQRLIKIIRERIKSEYRKHKAGDWDLIAAIKIINTLKEEGYLVDNDLHFHDLSTLSEMKTNWD